MSKMGDYKVLMEQVKDRKEAEMNGDQADKKQDDDETKGDDNQNKKYHGRDIINPKLQLQLGQDKFTVATIQKKLYNIIVFLSRGDTKKCLWFWAPGASSRPASDPPATPVRHPPTPSPLPSHAQAPSRWRYVAP